ncbi:hypothetical protein SAMN05518865_11696 [Duganella sp. CF458]|uniref:hypothetical protein n=1 Tax=Duganella sp. CF458 TaxID=1884368 RepID=UPI0008E97955|nr:hypothetical protein [Duganella sp. CF458]SFG69954.1 hypothetical protein SAMN05518865_11696 [Duganella sp. CF458]
MSTHFLHTVSELGAGNAAWYAAARLLRIVGLPMWRYHFVAQRVAPAAMRNSPGKLVMCPIASLADLPCQYPRPREVVAARFRQGGYSIAAWKGRELAAILWYQFGAYEEDEVRARYCLPSPRSCWDYDVFVQPNMRLGTAFCRLWDEAHRRMHARGIEWTCSRISAFNPGSLRAHRRLGAVHLGSATFIALGRWQLMLASHAPYIHLSAGPHSRPQLVFDTRPLEHGEQQCRLT